LIAEISPVDHSRSNNTLLIFSQVFVPDPASVGQHVADVATEMARRGHRLIVYTSARGYDDPTVKYPRRETLKGVEVRRLPLASFGKKSILTRIIGTVSFMGQALLAGLLARDLGGIFFSTSPPLVGVIATLIHWVRGAPIAYWLMDLNPDQLIALGKLRPRSPAAGLLRGVNGLILHESSLIVVLDRFMADRVDPRRRLRDRMLVMPPWPHEDYLGGCSVGPAATDREANPFRARHGLVGKFVVMYSGNHSPSNPLDTLLEAALAFRDDPDIRFLFVGGGIGKRRVEAFIHAHGLTNALSLPYQPLSELQHSLSAADVHVVSLGEPMVGIIHPCKVYGAMAVARPVLYFGPSPSHIADLLSEHQFGREVRHGDVAGAVEAIRELRAAAPCDRDEMGRRGAEALSRRLSQEILCSQFCDRLERAMGIE
jgi:colanic acid biosynthesis glycosyl transferase WcaI